jgi:hypothetical protein
MLFNSLRSNRRLTNLVHYVANRASSASLLKKHQQNKLKFFLIRKFNTSCIMDSSRVTKVYDNILKSQEDKRSYRGIEFDNGFKCLLISDPTTDKSAACVDVNVGYLVDTVPGLAHFCEHMLFLGSKKVP